MFSISNAHAEKRVRLPWPMRRKCFHPPKREEAGGVWIPSRPYGKQAAGKKPPRLDRSTRRKNRRPVSVYRKTTSGIRDRKTPAPPPFGKRRRTLLPIHTPRRERPLLVILLHASLLARAAENPLLVRDLPSHRRDVCNGGLSSQRLTPPRYVLALTVPFAWGFAPRSFEATA